MDIKTMDASLISIENIYQELVGFVYHMANRFQSDDLLDFEEIVAELNLEIVKGYKYYSGKILDLEQFKACLRQMLAFRIGELRHKQFGTHRIKARMNISIELELIGDDGDSDLTETIPDAYAENPECLCESAELVEEVKRRISPIAQQVMDVVCSGDKKLTALIFVATVRACGSKPNSHSKIKPWQVAEVLNIPEREARKAFCEIRKALQEVDGG